MSKLHIKKGDTVYVNAGNNKGKTGTVLKVFVEEKPSAKYPQGGIIKKEAPIHISNLNVVDPKSGKPTRIGRKRNDDGKLVRYAKKSGEESK